MGRKLFVGNLSYETTDDDLRQAFSAVGAVESATVIHDRVTGRSRGFGFVEMATEEETQQAIARVNGTDLRGRSISVNEARERGSAPSGPRSGPPPRNFGPPADPPPTFRKNGGSRRGIRARRRSL
jgi:RNA recognition motif-containing protein